MLLGVSINGEPKLIAFGGESEDGFAYNIDKWRHSPVLFHDRVIPAVARAARLRQEHVEVVRRVVPAVEAIATNGHAWRDAARAAPVGDDARYPHQAAFVVFVVAADCGQREINQIS